MKYLIHINNEQKPIYVNLNVLNFDCKETLVRFIKHVLFNSILGLPHGLVINKCCSFRKILSINATIASI